MDAAGKVLYSRDLERDRALEGLALARSMGAPCAVQLWDESAGMPDHSPPPMAPRIATRGRRILPVAPMQLHAEHLLVSCTGLTFAAYSNDRVFSHVS